MAQKLAPDKKNSRDISPVSPPFSISVILSTKANIITIMIIKFISILMIMIYTDDSNAQVMQEYQILSDHSLHPNIPVLFGAFRSFVTPTMIVKMI